MSSDLDDVEPALCPICSVPPHCAYRPSFHYMRRTSQKAGVDVHCFRGCSHVAVRITFNETNRREVIAEWNERAVKLFADKTAKWTDAQREALRIALSTHEK